MQRSFSIIEDNNVYNQDAEELIDAKCDKNDNSEVELTDSEENNNSPKRSCVLTASSTTLEKKIMRNTYGRQQTSKLPSAGPSGRQTVLRKKTSNTEKLIHTSSESEDSDRESKNNFTLAPTYDPKKFEDIDVDDTVKEIFQYILKYTPQQLNLDYKFKPFIPEFLPGVGDIDAYLKVIPPNLTINDEKFDEKSLNLGITVLDEPTLNQSDPALLYLQLRAASANLPNKRYEGNVATKKVDNVERNFKVIDKWIKDISDIHKSKLSSNVRYITQMPDLDDLMQEWPESMEIKLKEEGFPKFKEGDSISDYIVTICNIFEIPVVKKTTQSLHLLFCLYAAIKQTQLYQNSAAADKDNHNVGYHSSKKEADQLVLE